MVIKSHGVSAMGHSWQRELVKLLGTAVFLTAVFFAGRQAAVMTDSAVHRAEMEAEQDDHSKMQKFCVVVDAGHGGNDPGKVGVNGALEKDINLAIAKRLAVLLEQADVKAVLTRTGDSGLYDADADRKKVQDMKRRIELMEKTGPDIVVSIHQNSYEGASVSGAQVFYYTGSEEGKKLADIIQEQLILGLDPDNRREAKANDSYYLLRKTSRPIVIAECGFLSNPREEELLCDPSYQEKVAWQLHLGILRYLNGTKKSGA